MFEGTFSLLYRRNLLLQQIDVRWRALKAVASLIRGRHGAAFTVAMTSIIVFLLDIGLGCGVVWLWDRHEIGTLVEDGVSNYTVASLRTTRQLLDWVMGVPAGLKLNLPLSLFLGSRCLYLLRLWEMFYLDFLSIYLPILLPLLPPISATIGLTFSLSLIHDFFKFLNLCHICFFVFSSRLLSLQLSSLISLSRLFRGKKWNILRKRVDSCDYNTNQLLLGTIVFTILLFLLPTTTVFAVLFSSLRLLQLTVQLLLRTLVVCINWSTFSLLQSMEKREESLLNLRLTGGGVGVIWRGRKWTIEEMKREINRIDPCSIINDIIGNQPTLITKPSLATVAGLWTKL